MRRLLLLLTGLLAIFAASVAAFAQVPYVPTPERVVNAMLRLAKVGEGDVVYDLGCGDGRIVIAAAKLGARGVGVDTNPERIAEANENARKAGVQDRVRFIQQDLFETDLREATVVTLYLVPQVNLKLRPKLLKELRPGTRVVSHNYDMGDWTPREKRRVRSTFGRQHTLYLWTIPEITDRPPQASTYAPSAVGLAGHAHHAAGQAFSTTR